ncbi:ABC-three component system protein [Paraburkholderia atlantica]|uniref:ABC-three component system protein n=1 Tax=Paraburkholderia atlantica TaxID=2654982 RepID=UPI001EE63AAA|nr:ABC-three component system protein [Paraburkholderia atlantica]
MRTLDEFNVGLETLDDVVFESEGRPTDLLQAKHRLKRVAVLSDASPDIWKTFRIWLVARAAGQTDPATRLILVSTGVCVAGSAAYMLGDDDQRDEAGALALLITAAETSESQQNEEGCALFLALSDSDKRAFLRNVFVLDGVATVVDVEAELHTELRLAVPRPQIPNALNALEGWWFGQAVKQLSSPGGLRTVSSQAVELKLTDIREQCRADALLIDNEILQKKLDEAALNAYARYTFAKQVTLVTKNQRRLNRAITDYFRAFAQRSAWLRENLLLQENDDDFRRELYEAWDVRFARALDLLDAAASEQERIEAGEALLSWVETEADASLKAGFKASWMARGTLHELSNDREVGWHPDYFELTTPDVESDAQEK